MQKYKNLIIIGTSHIAEESIKQVEMMIEKEKPEIIALELDPARFNSLLSKDKKLRLADLTKLGTKIFLMNLIGAWIENKLGKIVNVKPGSEMKKAIELSKKLKLKIALIDQDIRITLKKLSKQITLREKLRFVFSIFKAFFKKPDINVDLTKVPSKAIIKKLTTQLKKDYPSVHKVLVKERNEIMAKNLKKLMSLNKTILAIVGAGHEEDIIELIKNDKV